MVDVRWTSKLRPKAFVDHPRAVAIDQHRKKFEFLEFETIDETITGTITVGAPTASCPTQLAKAKLRVARDIGETTEHKGVLWTSKNQTTSAEIDSPARAANMITGG
jgi:hypothetical protein